MLPDTIQTCHRVGGGCAGNPRTPFSNFMHLGLKQETEVGSATPPRKYVFVHGRRGGVDNLQNIKHLLTGHPQYNSFAVQSRSQSKISTQNHNQGQCVAHFFKTRQYVWCLHPQLKIIVSRAYYP